MEVLEPLLRVQQAWSNVVAAPTDLRRDDELLASALRALPPGRHAFEFRDPSWFADDVYSLLRDHAVALVIGDRASRPEAPWVDTAGWWYLRFHHGRSGQRATTRKLSSDAGRRGS